MSLAKKTTFMTVASIGQKLVAFLYFSLIARLIGAEQTGQYFFALSFTTVFVVFVDLGLTNVLIRESAKYKEKMQLYFSTIIGIKIVLAGLTYAALVGVVLARGYPVDTRHLVYLSGVTMLFDTLHLTLYGVLRAIGDIKWEAYSIVGSQLITLMLGSIFLWLGLPLIFLLLAFTIASGMNVVYAVWVLHNKYHVLLSPRYDSAVIVCIARIAIPFALAAVFARIYSYADTILLQEMAGYTSVGWYSIAYKITFAFQFVPLALVAVFYPRFSEYFESNKEKLARMFELSMKYLLTIAFPIAVGIAVLAKDIVLTLYTSEYLPAVPALQILILSLIFSFISFPIGAFLNACNKQVHQTTIVGCVMVLNIALNLVLIPRFGVVGAAGAAFVGNVFLPVLGYAIVPRITHIRHAFLFKTVVQLSVSTLVMAFAVHSINISFHFVFAIAVGTLVYPLMLFVTRVITPHDVRTLLGFFGTKSDIVPN